MEVAQFSGPRGCGITLPKAAAGTIRGPGRACLQRGPAPSQAAHRGQNQHQGAANAEAQSSALKELGPGRISVG